MFCIVIPSEYCFKYPPVTVVVEMADNRVSTVAVRLTSFTIVGSEEICGAFITVPRYTIRPALSAESIQYDTRDRDRRSVNVVRISMTYSQFCTSVLSVLSPS